MHGRKRAEYKARLSDPKLATALATKATQWHAVTAELLKRRKASVPSSDIPQSSNDPQKPQDVVYPVEETLKIIEKALLVNPDPLYLWSQRRDYLLQDLESLLDITTEFRLTQGALERNPKAYGPWFHRKWTLQQQWNVLLLSQAPNNSDTTTMVQQPPVHEQQLETLLQHELVLSAKFLSLDERNFHCWNYRRFIVALLWNNDSQNNNECRWDGSLEAFFDTHVGTMITGAQTGRRVSKNAQNQGLDGDAGGDTDAPQPLGAATAIMTERQVQLISTEWAFTEFKIQENFSNGSAFHYRSQLLPLMVVIRGNQDKVDEQFILQEELELVKNAMFTEPDDQTAWWYMVFLLDWAAAAARCGRPMANLVQILQDLKDSITELVQAEDYQTKWGLLGLHTVLDHLYQQQQQQGGEVLKTEMNSILDKLQVLDPDRANRYESMKT